MGKIALKEYLLILIFNTEFYQINIFNFDTICILIILSSVLGFI